MTEPASDRVRVRRSAARGNYEPAVALAILDEGTFAHVGVQTERGPIVLPMAYGRIDDTLYLHGAAANALLNEGAGAEVCVTVTLVDGLVLARSVFHHSVNYRSVVVRGRARKVDGAEKEAGLRAVTDHIVARWDDARGPNDAELRQTLVLALPLTEMSAKIRTGDPIDDDEDRAGPWWAGVVPLTQAWGPASAAADLDPDLDVPSPVQRLGQG